MITLALDPSSKGMGWALAADSGVWRPRGSWATKCTKEQLHIELCGRSAAWLSDMITEHGPSVLVIECGGGRQTDKCSERLRGALFAVGWTREIAVVPVDPKTWQAWARRMIPVCLTNWQTFGKPDDKAAEMILAWWFATEAHRVEAA